ncbi:hypothetical protein FBQ81_13125, partial [Chloroflexi bacterium CFX6]|nr:hypothetical protein [Chloroflexi bacterium CFX6]
MTKSKIFPIALILLGGAFVLGALFSWFDNLTTAEPVGLGKWIFDVLQFLVGAGAGIGGWLGLQKTKDQPARKIEMKDSSKYFEKVEHYHEAPLPEPEVHPTIGFIPAARVETYVHRGKIEDDVISFIRNGGSGAIIGVQAPGGLGKTELAKRTAEVLQDEFEVLWMDVGEKKPLQVIGEMLTKCGIQSLPTDTYEHLKNELQYAYRNHKFLVILDDVRQESLANLGDLLPPSPCAALVTSRIQQIGGVKTFPLDSMNWEQARELFEAILGNEVVKAELESIEKLADRCRFNPLAMEIAARRIRQFEGIKKPVARYFEIAQTKFSELKMEGDARWDMEYIFDISYDDLSEEDQEKFRMLSAFHPTGFSMKAISYLWKSEPSIARQILSRFTNLSLVKTVDVEIEGEGLVRYRLHDLLDEYATLKLKGSGKYNETKASLAQWLVDLFDDNDIPSVENMPFILPELDNLLYISEWAKGEKQADILALLTTTPRNWFYNNFREAWIYWFAWLETCLQLGVSDNRLKANVLQAIGDVQQFRDERDAALASYEQALKLFREIGAK